MITIGNYNELTVLRKVDFGFYLGSEEEEILLPAKYAPVGLKQGDSLSVFVYTDSEDRPIATTLTPHAKTGDYAFLAVNDTTSFGAFMDWGLEKDLLVPLNEQKFKMQKGQKYLIRVCLDQTTARVYGSTRIQALSDPVPKDLKEGEKVSLIISDITKIGILAVVNNSFTGMLYRDQTFEKLKPGDTRDGYILKIRDDGKIDLSLKKPGYGSLPDSSEKIMQQLEDSGGFLACHDKSDPETIRSIFAMSKKEFKKAIGNLYKKGIIDIMEKGICLKKEQ